MKIYERSFNSKLPHATGKAEGKVGDVVTYFNKDGVWQTREVAEVRGALLITMPFTNNDGDIIENEYTVTPKDIIRIDRDEA